MTLPDDWKVHKDEVFKHFTEGRDAMRKAWKELTEAGYIVVDSVRGQSGKIAEWDTTVLETRHQKAENQTSGKPACGESDTTKDLYIPKTNTHTVFDEKADKVIDYLNDKTGSHYRHRKTTREHIVARLRDGFTVDDCLKVIDKKCDEWLGTDFSKHLNNVTLFRPSNFERYLNQPGGSDEEELKEFDPSTLENQ